MLQHRGVSLRCMYQESIERQMTHKCTFNYVYIYIYYVHKTHPYALEKQAIVSNMYSKFMNIYSYRSLQIKHTTFWPLYKQVLWLQYNHKITLKMAVRMPGHVT